MPFTLLSCFTETCLPVGLVNVLGEGASKLPAGDLVSPIQAGMYELLEAVLFLI